MRHFICLAEIAITYVNGNTKPLTIVCTNMMLGRHMLMTKLVFNIMYKAVFVNTNVHLHMFVSRNFHTFMTRALTMSTNTHIHMTTDWLTDRNSVINTDKPTDVLMMVNNPLEPMSAINLISSSNTMVSTTMHKNPPMIMKVLSDAVRDNRIVMEMALLLNPEVSTVRVRNSILDTKSNRHVTLDR